MIRKDSLEKLTQNEMVSIIDDRVEDHRKKSKGIHGATGTATLVNTGTTTQTLNGRIVLAGSGLAWDDLRVDANSVKLPSSDPPTWTAYKGSLVLAFSDAAAGHEEGIYFTVQMPHNYLEGSAIYPHVHFVPQDNTGGNARWGLTYTWANLNAAFPAEETINVDAACGTTTDAHKMGTLTAITGTGKTISSMLICRLFRNSSHANDTYNGKSVYLLEFDIHYQIDSFGSSSETAK